MGQPASSPDPRPASSARPSVELRFFVPRDVADYLDERAQERFKSRNEYVRDILVNTYRQAKASS